MGLDIKSFFFCGFYIDNSSNQTQVRVKKTNKQQEHIDDDKRILKRVSVVVVFSLSSGRRNW